MRHSADWMVLVDDRILEWIEENDGTGTPAEMSRDDRIRVSKSTISRRTRKLADNGLLMHVGNGAYVITDEGEGYLDEEYDAGEEVWLSDGTSDGPAVNNGASEPNGA
jgi:hypothetical protein